MDPASDRRVGVEIEFAGLSEDRVAQIVCGTLGGTATISGTYARLITGSALGALRVELDTAWRDEIARGPTALDELAHLLIPVEIVTDPIAESDLARLEDLVPVLRDAGAQGTNAALTHGFGVHFNPELTDLTLPAILPVLQSYALLEPWLRHHEPMGLARRALPFTAAWPHALRCDLLLSSPPDLDALVALYLEHAPSRNYGLDLLPLLHHISPETVVRQLGKDAPGARPTYHFRLPSCRIDEPGWSLSEEWMKWKLVEYIAARPELLTQLNTRWQASWTRWPMGEETWVGVLGRVLNSLDTSEGHECPAR